MNDDFPFALFIFALILICVLAGVGAIVYAIIVGSCG